MAINHGLLQRSTQKADKTLSRHMSSNARAFVLLQWTQLLYLAINKQYSLPHITTRQMVTYAKAVTHPASSALADSQFSSPLPSGKSNLSLPYYHKAHQSYYQQGKWQSKIHKRWMDVSQRSLGNEHVWLLKCNCGGQNRKSFLKLQKIAYTTS